MSTRAVVCQGTGRRDQPVNEDSEKDTVKAAIAISLPLLRVTLEVTNNDDAIVGKGDKE